MICLNLSCPVNCSFLVDVHVWPGSHDGCPPIMGPSGVQSETLAKSVPALVTHACRSKLPICVGTGSSTTSQVLGYWRGPAQRQPRILLLPRWLAALPQASQGKNELFWNSNINNQIIRFPFAGHRIRQEDRHVWSGSRPADHVPKRVSTVIVDFKSSSRPMPRMRCIHFFRPCENALNTDRSTPCFNPDIFTLRNTLMDEMCINGKDHAKWTADDKTRHQRESPQQQQQHHLSTCLEELNTQLTH